MGAKEERTSSQLLSVANKVVSIYSGVEDQGFYCKTDSVKKDSAVDNNY
jgi:hypothetical protein